MDERILGKAACIQITLTLSSRHSVTVSLQLPHYIVVLIAGGVWIFLLALSLHSYQKEILAATIAWRSSPMPVDDNWHPSALRT
jgi:hypothetical protein